MSSFKSSHSLFIVFTGIIISIGRVVIEFIPSNDNNTQGTDYILATMAMINFIAFGLVIYFLFKDLTNIVISRISQSGISTEEKRKRRKYINIPLFIFLFIYLIFGIIYITMLRSSLLNDVMSILALALSIASNGIIDEYGDTYYKLIIKVSKLSESRKKT